MPKWSNVTPNSNPALTDYLMGVTSGNVDDRVLIQTLVNLILKTTLLNNPSKISVYRNGAWTASAALTLITFDAVTLDTGGDYSTSTGKYTARTAGAYFAASTIGVGTVAASHGAQIQLVVNGLGVKWGFQGANGTTQAMHIAVAGLVQLSVGDYLQVYAGGDAAAGATGAVNTFFDAFLVSGT